MTKFYNQINVFYCFFKINMLKYTYRARRRVSGALLPTIRYSGVECLMRFKFVKYERSAMMLKSRSYAIKIFEPGQSLTTASLRGHFDVP